jgi:hypothetical protein
MLNYLRIGKQKPVVGPDPIELSTSGLTTDPYSTIALRSLNRLHENIKQRIYRTLIPHHLLSRFDVDPITWRGPDKTPCAKLEAASGTGLVKLSAWSPFDPGDPFFTLEMADNAFNGIDLNWIILSDPTAERFETDVTPDGEPTLFGKARRNLAAEERALAAGLAPGQVRTGLRGSTEVFHQIDTFFIALGHRSYALEPLTYASAWLFERRGFAYMIGHQLMTTVHKEFQPGGRLNSALDGSTPFRQPDQWQTVRGRAWAIHDGILEAIDKQWDGVRMRKQLGRHAGVNTFPDAVY